MKRDSVKRVYLSVTALLFLVVSHLTVRNFGSPLVLPSAYFIWIAAAGIMLLSVINVFNEMEICASPYSKIYPYFSAAACICTL